MSSGSSSSAEGAAPERCPSGRVLPSPPECLGPHADNDIQRQQTGQHAAADQYPGQRRALLRTGLQQRHLADETGKGRYTTEIECGHHEHEGQQWARRRQPTQPLQRRRARLAFDQTDNQEQGGLHHDVVRDVVDRTGHAQLVRQRDAEHHVADVADECEGQQPLDVALRDRAEDADQHGEQGGDE